MNTLQITFTVSGGMQVFVRTLRIHGKTFSLDVQAIETTKSKIQEREGIPNDCKHSSF